MTASISPPTDQRAKRKPLPILVILLVVVAVVAPTIVYWVIERNDMHQRWELQARYAQQFFFHETYAASLLNGTFAKYGIYTQWNETALTVDNELVYADNELYGVEVLDTANSN